MRYMTEKRRIEEAYRSMNEWVERRNSDYAYIGDDRVTNNIKWSIAYELFGLAARVVSEGLIGRQVLRNAGVDVTFLIDGSEVVPGMNDDYDQILEGVFVTNKLIETQKVPVMGRLAESVGEDGFKLLPNDVIAIMPGRYGTKCNIHFGTSDDLDDHEVEVMLTVTRQIQFKHRMWSKWSRTMDHGGRGFRKPNLPESTVTEAENDREAFGMARQIAFDLAKSADAGDAEGVFRCFNGLRGVVNRLTP